MQSEVNGNSKYGDVGYQKKDCTCESDHGMSVRDSEIWPGIYSFHAEGLEAKSWYAFNSYSGT